MLLELHLPPRSKLNSIERKLKFTSDFSRSLEGRLEAGLFVHIRILSFISTSVKISRHVKLCDTFFLSLTTCWQLKSFTYIVPDIFSLFMCLLTLQYVPFLFIFFGGFRSPW